MKASRLHRGQQANSRLADDLLTVTALESRLFGHAGFPEAADALAYDAVQRILAVGTRDGRLKVFGSDGVECTFRSPFQTATKELQFLDNKGALLRLTTDGDIQLWGIDAGGFVDSLSNPPEDLFTAVCPLVDEPYVLLGCASGELHAAALLGSSGSPAGGAREASSLQKLPYNVSPEAMAGARGSIVVLACSTAGNLHRAIVVHSDSSPLVWDLRYKSVVVTTEAVLLPASSQAEPAPAAPRKMSWRPRARAQAAEPEQDAATCACWLGSRGDLFAVGYASGVVRLYSIPEAALGEPPPAVPIQAALQRELKPCPGAEAALPVRAVWHLPGSKASEPSSILILGGQGADEPDMLRVLPLEPSPEAEEQEQHPLPWFGAIQGLVLVPAQHSLDVRSEPAALMTLNEGGQLIVYDMKTLKPLPLSLPLQELPPITASAFLHDAPPPEEDEERPHAVTAADLRALHAASAELPERAAAHRWRWMLNGGKLPALDSTGEAQPLLLTGHRDGRVRMWDMACEVPRLLGTAPHDMGGPGTRLQAVSILKVCQASGLLLVGHAKGEARLYQYSSTAQDVTVANISSESREEPGVASSEQPAGFQVVLKLTLHEGAISAAALCSRAGLLALADHLGSLALVDLNRLTVLCTRQLAEQPLTALSFGTHSMQPQRLPGGKREAVDSHAEDRLVLCVEAGDCSLILLDARSGKPLNSSSKDPWLHPRHADAALGTFLLNANGLPACAPPGDCVLPWAQNTRDTHGISLHPHSSVSGETPLQDASSWESPSAHARGTRGFREATSVPESEGSSTGATASTGKPEPEQAPGQQHAEEQPVQKWHALAAKVNSETAESQCSVGHGLDALRMSLRPGDLNAHQATGLEPGSPEPGSPAYWQHAADIQVTSKRGSWVSGEVDSSADELEDDDDNDDLLLAAVAAVEAENKESKKGKKRFGILKKAAKKEDSHKEQKESMTEQQPMEQQRRESTPGREFTPQQKRALGRWVRSSIDKGRAAGPSSAAQPASEAPDGQIASQANAVPVRSPFADLPASEPPPGRRPAPAPAAASEASKQPAASGKDHARPGLSAGSREGQSAPASPQATEPGAGRQSQSGGQEHHSSASFHPKSSMSSTQSTGVPSAVAKVAIRGSISDNTHERFAAPHAEDDAAEASSPGAISHVVLASSNHIRLYTIENVREADRTTAKKIDLSQPIAFAGVFASQRGPGLACLSPTGILHVFALPGLELLLCQELQDGLTFPWKWKPEQAQLTRAAAVAQDGQLAMVSACGELARLGLVAGTPEPAAATSLYDWDLATAALAASHAVRRQLDALLAQNRPTQQPSPQPKEPQAASSSMAPPAPGKRGFGSFLSHVKDAASRVVDDTSKNLTQGLDILGARGTLGPDRAALQIAPGLETVLSSAPEAEGPEAHGASDGSTASGAATAVAERQHAAEEAQRPELLGSQGKRAARPQAGAESTISALFGGKEGHGKHNHHESASQEPDAASGTGGRHLWSEEDEGKRAGLFRGATAGAGKTQAGAKPGVRTAEDIKAAYGRPSTTKRADGLGGVMDENRARLAERGEKLRTLQDKMEAMSSDAEGFASMAKQLRDREANKKWWQL